MTARELATLAIRVLDTQAAYFRSRDHAILLQSKALEAELRREAEKILSVQETLDLAKISLTHPPPGCDHEARRVWSLWDIMNLYHAGELAHHLHELWLVENACLIYQVRGDGARRLDGTLQKQLIEALGGVLKACMDSGLADCSGRTTEIGQRLFTLSENKEFVPKDLVNVSTVAAVLGSLKRELVKSLKERTFVRVDMAMVPFVDKDEIFGPDVSAAFPSAQRDLTEAGNCIAIGCGTAAVFHLMRGSEFALRALARDRDVSFKDKPLEEKQWGEILPNLESKIQLLRDSPRTSWNGTATKDEQVRFYSEAIQELRSFNDAWRRHVSHADTLAFYDPDDAMGVFKHVRTFMQKVSARVSEREITPLYWP